MNIITIHGVRGYLDDSGTAFLNLEDVSRGLGFTQTAASGNEVVRWERVNKYLSDFDFIPTSGDGCIPENIFYRLAMKAKNEFAEAFQAKVADDILPSIRKHGAYMTADTIEKTLTNPDFIIQLATKLKEEQTARIAAESKVHEQQRKLQEQETPIAIYNMAIAAHNTMSMQEVAKSFGTGRTRLYNLLRDESIIIKGSTLPHQRFIDAGYFKVVERPRAQGDTIHNDPATRVTAKGFEYIGKIIKRKATEHFATAETESVLQ